MKVISSLLFIFSIGVVFSQSNVSAPISASISETFRGATNVVSVDIPSNKLTAVSNPTMVNVKAQGLISGVSPVVTINIRRKEQTVKTIASKPLAQVKVIEARPTATPTTITAKVDNSHLQLDQVNGDIGFRSGQVATSTPTPTSTPQKETPTYSIKYGKYYALIIGVENYQYFEPLDNPITDAGKVKDILVSKYDFNAENVKLLANPSRADILDEMDELASKITINDNLLIFYAGHGTWDQESKVGYWLPVDAKKDKRSAWISNSTVVDYLASIKSKHTLLITDACFSGGIFKSRDAKLDNYNVSNKLYSYKSRKAITSGTLTTVPDNSVFTKYLVQRLNENTEKYLSAEVLFGSFKIAVLNNSSTIPQYGTIKNVGDEGGDFIFVLKK